MRSARCACSFSSRLVEARRAACFFASVRCAEGLAAKEPVVLLIVLFTVQDISVASLLPGR